MLDFICLNLKPVNFMMILLNSDNVPRVALPFESIVLKGPDPSPSVLTTIYPKPHSYFLNSQLS